MQTTSQSDYRPGGWRVWELKQFHNKHAGERCAILANGESVAAFPDCWKEPVIGLNRSWEITDAPYHCIIDLKQLIWAKDHGVEFKHLFVGQGDDDPKEACKLAVIDGINAETVTLLYGQESRYGLGFCTNLSSAQSSSCLCEGMGCGCDTLYIPSVPYMALQLARWMGFKEMHFWGLDLHGAKFWDSGWDIPKSTARLQDRQFKYADRKLKALGVRVVNHSKGTHCTAFERV